MSFARGKSHLAKTLASRSLKDIGRRFGDRDHTTVLHAVRKIDTQVGTNRLWRIRPQAIAADWRVSDGASLFCAGIILANSGPRPGHYPRCRKARGPTFNCA